MKYFIDYEETTREEFFERLEEEVNIECENGYDDMLNECYEEVEICGCHYDVATVLYRVDPIAYRCGLSDYTSSQLEDYKSEFEYETSITIDGVEFETQEEEEEEEE